MGSDAMLLAVASHGGILVVCWDFRELSNVIRTGITHSLRMFVQLR